MKKAFMESIRPTNHGVKVECHKQVQSEVAINLNGDTPKRMPIFFAYLHTVWSNCKQVSD